MINKFFNFEFRISVIRILNLGPPCEWIKDQAQEGLISFDIFANYGRRVSLELAFKHGFTTNYLTCSFNLNLSKVRELRKTEDRSEEFQVSGYIL